MEMQLVRNASHQVRAVANCKQPLLSKIVHLRLVVSFLACFNKATPSDTC